MPCFAIHLAIAKEYLKRNKGTENEEEFILGTIAPDIATDKNAAHYGYNFDTTDAIEYMRKKVDLDKFLQTNQLDTSFNRGYFLHLISDYRFFGDYITSSIIKGRSIREIAKIGYADYNRITPILIKKFNLVVPENLSEIMSQQSSGDLELLEMDQIYRFIDDMAEFRFDKYSKNKKK